MYTWAKRTLLALVVIVVVIQLFWPSRTNPASDPKSEISASLTVPQDVEAILTRSCYDCHSNRTVWPWYSHVAPVSWLVAYDVNHGRKALNLSEWGLRDQAKNGKMLGEICKEVTEKEMPGFVYPIMHPRAKLTDADIQTICRWTEEARRGSAAETTPTTR
jgi:Haem-binding domain